MGITGYKGFGPDWKCRDFQYEVGGEYEEDRASICDCGFHFCESPFDVLNHYPFINSEAKFNRFADIEADGVSDARRPEDSKRVSTKLKVVAEIGIPGLVKAAINFIRATASKETATTGDFAHSATTGYFAHSATTGDFAHSATTGYRAHSATTGDKAHSATTGYKAHSATTGDKAHSAVSGKECIAASLGINGRASGSLGCWIVLADWDCVDGEWKIQSVKTALVDGEKIKPDVFYTLQKGEFVAVG